MPPVPSRLPREKRIQPRLPLRLRVDARLLSEREREDILAGLGHAELETEALALSRPRWGMRRLDSRDVSASGLRLAVQGLEGLGPGTALCLDLHLPGDQRVVKLLGDVMWTGAEEGGQAVAGLRIAALEREGFERLRQALARAPRA